MNNILLLTNIYPNNDPKYRGTSVCHSFVKEWVKMGYNVRVVHFDSLFPRPYYWIAKMFEEYIMAKTGAIAYTSTPRKPQRYLVDGIKVLFIPLRKFIPHKAPSQHLTKKAFSLICEELAKDQFVPDVITGHFVLPQLQFMPLLRKRYPNAKICLVPHGLSDEFSYYYPKNFIQLMSSVDVFGFRSLAFKRDFERKFPNFKNTFLCLSGIPEKYMEPVNKDFDGGVKHFAFVGSLLELKNVNITLKALHKVMQDREYVFDIVGSGAEFKNLQQLTNELGINDRVVFHGKKSRDEAQQILKDADCFIMVSAHEAFGLVYVEAMIKGCIVVGTEGQGIDGVVIDGENGFLCKAGDVDALALLIKRIVNMPQDRLIQISEKAIETAKELSDSNVAKNYIDAITKIG